MMTADDTVSRNKTQEVNNALLFRTRSRTPVLFFLLYLLFFHRRFSINLLLIETLL